MGFNHCTWVSKEGKLGTRKILNAITFSSCACWKSSMRINVVTRRLVCLKNKKI